METKKVQKKRIASFEESIGRLNATFETIRNGTAKFHEVDKNGVKTGKVMAMDEVLNKILQAHGLKEVDR